MVGPPPRLIKSDLAWSVQRANLSEKDKFLKTVKGMVNKLTPEKLDLLKGQLMESGITTDTLKVLFFSSCELFDCSQSSNSSKSLFVV